MSPAKVQHESRAILCRRVAWVLRTSSIFTFVLAFPNQQKLSTSARNTCVSEPFRIPRPEPMTARSAFWRSAASH